MPTYSCSLRAGALAQEQKAAVAQAIARIHSEATGAPIYFVQVIFDEHGEADRFLGGRASADHIWIRGDIRSGRSQAQKAELMRRIVTDVAAIAGLDPALIWVYLCDLAPTDMIEYGHVLPPPGAEQAWFDGLPQALQDQLTDAAGNRPTSL